MPDLSLSLIPIEQERDEYPRGLVRSSSTVLTLDRDVALWEALEGANPHRLPVAWTEVQALGVRVPPRATYDATGTDPRYLTASRLALVMEKHRREVLDAGGSSPPSRNVAAEWYVATLPGDTEVCLFWTTEEKET